MLQCTSIFTTARAFGARLAFMASACLLSLVMLFVPISASAQVNPATLLSSQIGSSASSNANEPPHSDAKPDVFNLKAGWWHYFLDDELLSERAESFIADLEQLVEQNSENDNIQALSQQLDLIRAALNGYIAAVTIQDDGSANTLEAFRDRYTPTQMIGIDAAIYQLNQQQSQLQSELSNARASRQNVSDRLDTRFANYLQSSGQGMDRLIAAYEIIADRFTIMLANERIGLREADLASVETRLSNRKAELDYAKAHLISDERSISEAEEKIAALQADVEEAQQRLSEARSEAVQLTGSGIIERVRMRLLNLFEINAQLQAVVAETQLLRWQADLILQRLLAGEIEPETARAEMARHLDRQSALAQDVDAAQSDLEELNVSTSPPDRSISDGLESELSDAQIKEYESLQQDIEDARRNTQLYLGNYQLYNRHLSLLEQTMELEIFDQEGFFENLGGKLRLWASNTWNFATSSFNNSLFKIGDTPVTPRGILIAISIMLFGWLLSWIVRRFLSSLSDENNYHHSVYYTVGRLTHYVLILLSFLLGISVLGISLTSFAVVAGALAIGIGFGLQAIVNNFISGLIILFERSLKVGDFIEFTNTGLQGEVKAINVRSTQIKTNDNIDIVVPNSEFMNTKVVNWTLQEPYRRAIYDFRIGFDADKAKVRECVSKAASELPYTLTGIPGKAPQVWLTGFGDFAYKMQLAVWLKPSAVKRPQVVNAAYYWAIDDALREAGIQIPIPQREIYLHGSADQRTTLTQTVQDSEPTSESSPE